MEPAQVYQFGWVDHVTRTRSGAVGTSLWRVGEYHHTPAVRDEYPLPSGRPMVGYCVVCGRTVVRNAGRWWE